MRNQQIAGNIRDSHEPHYRNWQVDWNDIEGILDDLDSRIHELELRITEIKRT